MVDGNVEEALNLVCMEIHRNHAIDTSSTQQVCHQFCANADTWFVLTILTRPSEIGDDSIDGTGRCTLGGINHQEQLHQIVRIGERALYEEDVASTDAFLIRNSKLAVGELGDKKFT